MKNLSFKNIRSFIGNLLPEKLQMRFVINLSSFFWFLRKYFLGVEINYPSNFKDNWNIIKGTSSKDIERKFSLYQIINLHNKIFNQKKTNIIEFGVDRGGSLRTICKFIKNNSEIYGLDSFGFFSSSLSQQFTDYDPHYKHSNKEHFTNKRFEHFDFKEFESSLNQDLNIKNCKLTLFKCLFPDSLTEDSYNLIKSKKYSLVHLDFDLYSPTLQAINLIIPRLEKNALVVLDDYNFINQEGIKKAVLDANLDLDSCIQNQSGQLIYLHN